MKAEDLDFLISSQQILYRIPGESKLYEVAWHAFRGKNDLKKYIKHVDPHILTNVAGSNALREEKGLRVYEPCKSWGRIKRPLITLKTGNKYKVLDGRHRAGWALALKFKTVPILVLEYERKG